MFDYDADSKHAAEVLDRYDFSSVLRNCYGVKLYDVKEWLERYGEEVSEAISDLTTDELAEYLRQKYGVRVEEVLRYYIWGNDKMVKRDG